jgi:hypothetical protein
MQPIADFFSLHSIHGVQHVAFILVAVGLVGSLIAIRRAGRTDTPPVASRAQAWGSLCAGVLIGAGVTVGVLVLQQWLADANAAAAWRTSVQTAASMPGLTPVHSLQGLVLSGKDLHDAELKGANLQGLQMRDTNLKGANLQGADLRHANLIGANLSTAELGNANLSGAHLEAARFDSASVEHVRSFAGAHADALTCWPDGFLALPIASKIKAEPYDNGHGDEITIRGNEPPDCIKPR